MSTIVLTFPILPGKIEAWRRFCQEISTSRQNMYLSSRRRLGITHEQMAIAENKYGAKSVTTLETQDIGWVLGQIITSVLPFDCWYRDKMREIHGINLTGYEQFLQSVPSLQNQEILFEWILDTEKLRRVKPYRCNSITGTNEKETQ